jgi:DNA-binding NarL/FixJ family response regulator
MIRALLVDDHSTIREGLTMYLVSSMDILVDEAVDGFAALEYLKNNVPDILILDISMPGMDGFETLSHVRQMRPGLPTLMLSAYSEDVWARKSIAEGARGYLMKTAVTEELVDAITAILAGEIWVSKEVAFRFDEMGKVDTSSKEEE